MSRNCELKMLSALLCLPLSIEFDIYSDDKIQDGPNAMRDNVIMNDFQDLGCFGPIAGRCGFSVEQFSCSTPNSIWPTLPIHPVIMKRVVIQCGAFVGDLKATYDFIDLDLRSDLCFICIEIFGVGIPLLGIFSLICCIWQNPTIRSTSCPFLEAPFCVLRPTDLLNSGIGWVPNLQPHKQKETEHEIMPLRMKWI